MCLLVNAHLPRPPQNLILPTPQEILPLHENQPHEALPHEVRPPHHLKWIHQESYLTFVRHSLEVYSKIHRCTPTWQQQLPSKVPKRHGHNILSSATLNSFRSTINNPRTPGSTGHESCVHHVILCLCICVESTAVT